MAKTVVFALVGGVASGKSAVARAFEKRGARVIDADTVGHEVLRGGAAKREIVAKFGQAVLGPDGEIDRKVLGAAVFGDERAVEALNAITHPRIRALIKRRMARALAEKPPALVLDISLLLESGAYEGHYDVLAFVQARETSRLARAKERGWGKAEVRRRQAHQLPLREKLRRADVVIENDGSLADLDRRVGDIWKEFVVSGQRQGGGASRAVHA